MISEQQVLANLDAVSGRTAQEIATRLGCHKADINPHLYRMLEQRVVHKVDLKWFLIKTKNPRDTPKVVDPTIASAIPSHYTKKPDIGTRPIKIGAAPSPSRPIEWTSEQDLIINGPVGARGLVEAGPGTGKTAVACARVAKLLREDDVTPSSILMVSFTRTAVSEMKDRIRLWADSGKVSGVNISTLDQTAFTFGAGCGQKFETLMASFDDNIQNTLDQFNRKNALLLEYVGGLDHIIIDEAQDLIGPRAELAIHLLRALRPDAGATIFADACQAIYGFTTDVDPSLPTHKNFLQLFNPGSYGFKTSKLTKIHRSADAKILELFTNSRQKLTESHSSGSSHFKQVIKAAEEAAPCEGNSVENFHLEDGDLLLYRKRASAVMHASWCPKLFRLRLPAHPPAIFAWIGIIFSDTTDTLVSQTQFVNMWNAKVPTGMTDGFTAERAWGLLHRFAGKRHDVDLTRLRSLLSRPRPQVEFCQLDYGGVGPVFSTIHASKGREADRVYLMLPRNLDYLDKSNNLDPEEEARVFYVGSTRVRKQFLRGIAHSLANSRRLDDFNERIIQLCASDKHKFQVGLARDFDDLAPISRDSFFCQNAANALSQQKHLVLLWKQCLSVGSPTEVKGISQPKERADIWPCRFQADDNHVLAWSSDKFGKDLWKMNSLVEIKFGKKCHPPRYINHLRLIGLRTCVAAADNLAALGRIHKPFSDSGFWLAPMIVGFPSIHFPGRT